MDKKISIEEWKKRREMSVTLDAILCQQGFDLVSTEVDINTGEFKVYVAEGTSWKDAPDSHEGIPVRYSEGRHGEFANN